MICEIARPRIVFSTSRHWYSRFIRWASGSQASHVMLQFEVFGEELFLHASIGGIQFTPRKRWLRDNQIIREYEILRVVPRERIASMIECLNDSYDYSGLLGFLLVLAARKMGRKLGNPLDRPHSAVCSEFVSMLDPRGEIIGSFVRLIPAETTPQDLWLVCLAASVAGDLKEL